jgi:hypothetical protein
VAAGYALGALAFRRIDRERFFVVVLVLGRARARRAWWRAGGLR